jgi:hypothetical protein
MVKGWNKIKANKEQRYERLESDQDLWQSIIADPAFGDAAYIESRKRRPSISLYGWSAVEEVIPRFMALLGPEAACLTEEALREETGCSPEDLKKYLTDAWRQHHVVKVARMEETPGPFSMLLIRGGGFCDIFSLEIWSPINLPSSTQSVQRRVA